jgi:hypothetical protein
MISVPTTPLKKDPRPKTPPRPDNAGATPSPRDVSDLVPRSWGAAGLDRMGSAREGWARSEASDDPTAGGTSCLVTK